MKMYQRVKLFLIVSATLVYLTGCNEDDATKVNYPAEVESFLKQVKEDPMIVNDVTLGDSWRLVREEGSYDDDGIQKEFEYDLLHDSDVGSYKEYWIFDTNQVMMVFSGERFGKSWDEYFEVFNQVSDLPNMMLSIDYVYDDGDKQYTQHWTISSLTSKELVLTAESPDGDYFYQYTFRRENPQ